MTCTQGLSVRERKGYSYSRLLPCTKPREVAWITRSERVHLLAATWRELKEGPVTLGSVISIITELSRPWPWSLPVSNSGQATAPKRQIPRSGGFRRAPKFFQFHAVFGKIWQNHMLAPPPPPPGNPGSAAVATHVFCGEGMAPQEATRLRNGSFTRHEMDLGTDSHANPIPVVDS